MLGYSISGAFNITIYNCSMYKNTASVGANLFLSVFVPTYCSLSIHVVSFFGGNSISKGRGIMLTTLNIVTSLYT